MKKFTIILAALLVSFTSSEAQTRGAKPKPKAKAEQEQSDARAKKILKNVSKKYKSYKTIKAEFSVTNENAQTKKRDKQNGTIYLKGNKFKLDIAGQEVTCDGKTVWTYLKEAKEVQITKYDPQANEVNPNEIFTLYERKGFIYKYVNDVNEGGKALQLIEMTPTDKTKLYFKIKLYIDKANESVQKLTIMNKDGSSTTYEIIKLTPNFKVTDKFFSFDPKEHPGVRVDDLTK